MNQENGLLARCWRCRSADLGCADLLDLFWAAESLMEDATGCWLLSGSAGELGWPAGGVAESPWRGSGAHRRCCTDLDKGLSPDRVQAGLDLDLVLSLLLMRPAGRTWPGDSAGRCCCCGCAAWSAANRRGGARWGAAEEGCARLRTWPRQGEGSRWLYTAWFWFGSAAAYGEREMGGAAAAC